MAAITHFDSAGPSLNGYYLRPTTAYKASTIFGGDENAASVLDGKPAVSFADILKEGLGAVNNMQIEADTLSTRFAAGETDNIHEVLIAAEKADIALQLATAIRSKLLDAYQEIMRMQL